MRLELGEWRCSGLTWQQGRQLLKKRKKKQSSHVGNVPTEGRQQQEEKKRTRLWARGFQLPFDYGDVSGSQLQTVAWEVVALIKHRQGLAEVAGEPAGSRPYSVVVSSMSYMESNCVSVGGENRGGGLQTPQDAILLWRALQQTQHSWESSPGPSVPGLARTMGWPNDP